MANIEIGKLYKVGEFFWIENFIGFAPHAMHGHDLDSNKYGSVDIDCKVIVKKIIDNVAVVELYRNEVPYGAKAPIGSVFAIKVDQILSWENKFKNMESENMENKAIINEIYGEM